jgi:hypothetical protein
MENVAEKDVDIVYMGWRLVMSRRENLWFGMEPTICD